MSAVQYPFIDIAVHPRIRARLAGGEAIVIFSPDMRNALWANGRGAELFGHASIYDFLDHGAAPASVSLRQAEAAARPLRSPGESRSFVIRVTHGFQRAAVQAVCELIEIGRDRAILFAAPAAEGALSVAQCAARMIDGFDDTDTHRAVLDGNGAIVAASPRFAALGLASHTTRMLLDMVEGQGSGPVKRRVPTALGTLPAALGKVSDTPPLHLLFIVEADTGMAAPDQGPSPVAGEDRVSDTAAAATADGNEADAFDHDRPVPQAVAPGRAETAPDVDAATLDALAAIAEQEEEPVEEPAFQPLDILPAGGAVHHVEPEAATHDDDAGETGCDTEAQAAADRHAEAAAGENNDNTAPHDAPDEADAHPPAESRTFASRTQRLVEGSAPFVFTPDMRATRFVWKIDTEGRFTEISSEFARVVGPHAADIAGFAFSDLAALFNFDPDGKIGELLQRRDTWSGKTIWWPIEGTTLKVPVDLAALPTYTRTREFDGFRGFGIVRVADVAEDPLAIGLTLVPPPAMPDAKTADDEPGLDERAETFRPLPDTTPAVSDALGDDEHENTIGIEGEPGPATDATAALRHLAAGSATGGTPARNDDAGQDAAAPVGIDDADTDNAENVLDDLIDEDGRDDGRAKEERARGADEEGINTPALPDFSRRDVPALRIVDTPARRHSDKVIQFEERRLRKDGLTADEQAAFREIGRRLEPVAGRDHGQAGDTSPTAVLPKAGPQPHEADQLSEREASVVAMQQRMQNQPANDDERSTAREPEGGNGAAQDPVARNAFSAETAQGAVIAGFDVEGTASEAHREGAGRVGTMTAGMMDVQDGNEAEVGADGAKGERSAVDGDEASQPASDVTPGGESAADALPRSNTGPDADRDNDDLLTETDGDEDVANVAAGDHATTSSDESKDQGSGSGDADLAHERNGNADATGLDADQTDASSDDAPQGDDARQLGEAETDGSASLDHAARPEDGGRMSHAGIARARFGLTAEILDQMPVALLVHAGDTLIHGNPEFLRLTGYDTLEQLRALGGLDALLQREELDSKTSEAGGMVVVRADDVLVRVSARLQSIRWDQSTALMLALMPVVTEPSPVRPADADPVVPAIPAPAPLTTPANPPVSSQDLAPAAAPSGPAETSAADVARLQVEVDELRSILETATDGVVIIGADGDIRSMNRAASALFNYDNDETVGRPFVMLFAHESQRAIIDYLGGLSGNGVASLLNDGREVIGREAGGGFLPLFMTIGRLTSSNGYCAVIRDITQWKRTEEELRNAKRAAETANAHKSEFLAHVSHEIRTPLNAIIGFADMMATERFGPIGHPRYIEYANDIGRSGRHVLDIVNDLLDISKIEAGEMDLQFEPVGLNETVSETVSIIQPQANGQRVIIRTALSQAVPPVVADLRSVKQIVLNILSNAIRFTPSGGQIVVSTAFEANGSVILRIRDTGIGMTRSELELAMQPFRQVTGAARKRGDGTGLGLPLTKAMVDANRAAFAITSAPNEGTLVEITFPPPRVLAT